MKNINKNEREKMSSIRLDITKIVLLIGLLLLLLLYLIGCGDAGVGDNVSVSLMGGNNTLSEVKIYKN